MRSTGNPNSNSWVTLSWWFSVRRTSTAFVTTTNRSRANTIIGSDKHTFENDLGWSMQRLRYHHSNIWPIKTIPRARVSFDMNISYQIGDFGVWFRLLCQKDNLPNEKDAMQRSWWNLVYLLKLLKQLSKSYNVETVEKLFKTFPFPEHFTVYQHVHRHVLNMFNLIFRLTFAFSQSSKLSPK